MKFTGLKMFALVLFVSGLAGTADAEEIVQSSRSAGKFATDQSVDLSQALQQADPVIRPRPTSSESYADSDAGQRFAGIANRHDQLFAIYDADVTLLSDLDGDGFHHALSLSFDVDVNYDGATVYAKLYLSRQGEPWSQYYTTELFDIHGDDAADAYQVETELLEGYAPGYYAVLIEIYSLDHAYLVTSEVVDYHYLGWDIALEDLYRDERVVEYYTEVSVSHGASSMGSLLLFLLFIQVVIAARGFLAPTPCKKSDIKTRK